MKDIFFFDTYALIKLIEGDPAYEKYANSEMLLCCLNLIEFDYHCIKERWKDRASLFQYLKELCVPIDDETIQTATEWRYENRKKNISYADAIGYCLAKKHKIRFLTGDQAFKDLPNVEFIRGST